jgi:hypothetical protein
VLWLLAAIVTVAIVAILAVVLWHAGKAMSDYMDIT